jgi:integrase
VDLTRPFDRDGFLFPGLRKGVISDMTMGQHMKKAGLDYRPHGFRSSFRDWVADRTNAPREVAETSLGHVAGSQVERAYRRTDYLEQRRQIMGMWAGYVTGEEEAIDESF